MIFSFATANLFHQPFEQVLEMIAEAGFQHVELDLYWARKEWAMAQHLKDMPMRRAVQLVERTGLRVSSIHDGGGVLDHAHTTQGFINPTLGQVLDAMGYAPDYLVFHTPHVEGDPGDGWWERISGEIVRSLEPYRTAVPFVTIENMPTFDGYFIPLLTPDALCAFARENGLGVTLDTTHYAQMGTDITEAARSLGSSVRSIHLSDYCGGKTHLFIGDGELDFQGFFTAVDRDCLYATTLECSLSTPDHPDREMSRELLVARLTTARHRAEVLLN